MNINTGKRSIGMGDGNDAGGKLGKRMYNDMCVCKCHNQTHHKINLTPPSKIRSKRSGQMMRFKAHDRNYGFFFDSTPI